MADDKEYREMVKEMLDAEDAGFNDWEVEFLDNMYKRTTFSTAMQNKIEEIYKAKM